MRRGRTWPRSWSGYGSGGTASRSKSETTAACVGDHGDAAEAIQRAEELVGLSDRINELDRRMRTGPTHRDESETLPGGTEVDPAVLRR